MVTSCAKRKEERYSYIGKRQSILVGLQYQHEGTPVLTWYCNSNMLPCPPGLWELCSKFSSLFYLKINYAQIYSAPIKLLLLPIYNLPSDMSPLPIASYILFFL